MNTWTAPPETVALIFDCDGTLADTMPIHYIAWRQALDPVEIPFSEERFYQLGGMPTSAIIRLLAEEAGRSVNATQIKRLIRVKEAAFLERLDDVAPIRPVFDIARRYHGMLPLALASGGQRNVVERTIRSIGGLELFDAIVCAEDTTRHKPEPDVFLEAARRLGIAQPHRCVVFEDTELGLTAARRAGMTGVDIRPWLSNPLLNTKPAYERNPDL